MQLFPTVLTTPYSSQQRGVEPLKSSLIVILLMTRLRTEELMQGRLMQLMTTVTVLEQMTNTEVRPRNDLTLLSTYQGMFYLNAVQYSIQSNGSSLDLPCRSKRSL